MGNPPYSITPVSRTLGGLGATGLVDLPARRRIPAMKDSPAFRRGCTLTLDVAASRLDRAQTNDAPAADPRELYMNGTPVAALPPGLLDSPLQVRRGA